MTPRQWAGRPAKAASDSRLQPSVVFGKLYICLVCAYICTRICIILGLYLAYCVCIIILYCIFVCNCITMIKFLFLIREELDQCLMVYSKLILQYKDTLATYQVFSKCIFILLQISPFCVNCSITLYCLFFCTISPLFPIFDFYLVDI